VDAGAVAADLRGYIGPSSRGRRRWRAVVAGLLVIGLIATAAVLIWRDRPKAETEQAKRERLERELFDRLRGPGSVTLVNADGQSNYYRTVAARAGTIPVDTSLGFMVTTLDEVLVELVPAGLMDGPFELTGEAQYRWQVDDASRVGLYFSHAPGGTGAGHHTYATLGYREFGGANRNHGDPKTLVGAYGLWLSHWVEPEQPDIPRGDVPTAFFRRFETPRPASKDDSPWRTLRLRVNTESATLQFDTQAQATVTYLEMDQCWRIRPQHLPRPPFGLSGGIGIHVCNATAAFRNITIRRLD
jgi:hypothetical protein